MGGRQTVQPMLGKEGVWPANVIPSVPVAAATENAPQPNPAILGRLHAAVGAVLEVCELAPEDSVHIRNHTLQAPAVRAKDKG